MYPVILDLTSHLQRLPRAVSTLSAMTSPRAAMPPMPEDVGEESYIAPLKGKTSRENPSYVCSLSSKDIRTGKEHH
jgi:hypothetical protein